MHEMAIAEGILDVALVTARKNQASKIFEVGLLLGDMTGVEMDALLFAWETVTKGTEAQGAVLSVKKIPLCGKCMKCSFEMVIKEYNFVCPRCQGTLKIISGRELQVEFLEAE